MLYRGEAVKLGVILGEMSWVERCKKHGEREALGPGPWEILSIENEGESHDVIENKGPDFLSHDSHDK